MKAKVCFTDEGMMFAQDARGFTQCEGLRSRQEEARHFLYPLRLPVQVHSVILALCQPQITPEASHISALRCQYSYWALRIFARKSDDPTVHFWLSLIQEPEDPRLNPGDEVLLFVYYDMSSIPGVLLRSFPWNLGFWILDPEAPGSKKWSVCKRLQTLRL